LTIRKEIQQILDKYGDLNLIDMLHAYLAEKNQKEQQKRYEEGRIGKFYPSSVGQCKRKVVYQMMGYPGKPIPGRNLLVLDNGTYFHERMERYFEEMGLLIAPELKLVNEELRISGRSDAIIWNFLKGNRQPPKEDPIITLYRPGKDGGPDELVYKGPASDVLIVEFKSIKSRSYHEYLPKTKPKREHEMQLQLYFYLTGIREGLVYYENKDTQEHKYYHVTYNQQLVDEIIADIRFILKHVDEGTLPEREFPPTSFECRYCDYRDICYPVQNTYNLEEMI